MTKLNYKSAKTLFYITIASSNFLICELAYARYCLRNVNITEYHCKGSSCIIKTTADTNHVLPGTNSKPLDCKLGVFGWDFNNNNRMTKELFDAFISWTNISFTYAQFKCYENSTDGFKTMYLEEAWIKKENCTGRKYP